MTSASIPQKRCTRCNEELPATLDCFTKNGHGGLYHHCKSCRKLDRKEDRAKNGDKIRAQRKVSDGKRKDKIKVYQDNWNIENKDYIREYKHEYYLEHRDEIIERVKQYYQDNKEARKAYISQWQRDNPEKIRIYAKTNYQRHKREKYVYALEYRQRNRERMRQRARDAYARNPAKFIAYQHKRRAREIAAEGNFTKEDIRLQYKSQRGNCWHCGKSVGAKYHADHLYPLSLGGSNSARNIVISCPFCNLSKGDKPTWEWNGRLL